MRQHLTWREFRHRCGKRYVQQVLRRTQGNMSEAARQVDMDRSHFYGLVKRLGINHHDFIPRTRKAD